MRLARLVAVAAVTIALGSCGDSDSEGAAEPSATSAAPTTVELPTTTEAAVETETTASEDTSVSEETTTTVEAVSDVEAVVFNNDFGTSVAPILASRCASCHAPGGAGTAHWTLATADDAAHEANAIAGAVAIGYMPPWPASHESVPFQDDLSLSDSEIAAVVDWVRAGAELDVDPTTPIVATERRGLDETDAELAPAVPYTGSLANTDDYRCQIYDPELSETKALTGYDFVPDEATVVHHAIGWMLPAGSMQDALDKDASEDGAGWECYGGSGIGRDEMLIGWAPGQDASNFPDGSGYIMEPGDFFVIQIHYHYETSAPADASELHLDFGNADELTSEVLVRQYVAPVEIPCTTEQEGPLCDRDAAIKAAVARFGSEGVRADGINSICGASPSDFANMTDGVASSSCDLPIYGFGEIVTVLGHEHEIGASFRMTLNPDTPDEVVLLDIPDWDFDWQYNYAPQESIVLVPGDKVRIECSWDRARQRPGVEPSYILWADGTNDEMCFATIVTRG